MKNIFNKIIGFGIKKTHPESVAEKMKLVNGISLLGVPVCLLYGILFAVTGYYFISVVFFSGIIIFIVPVFINALFGLKYGRAFICTMAPVLFGIITIMTGREAGFYLGFLVVSTPPMLVYSRLSRALLFFGICAALLVASIIGLMFIPPIVKITFAMPVFLVNLFTVLFTGIGVVFLFKKELSESRHKLQEKNKEMVDSINYAYRIQQAILPQVKYINENLKDTFLIYKPKDIVAGDFYWMHKVVNSEITLIAVADCTGHGVPGAIVSVVCSNALNRAVKEFGITEPGKILDKSRELVQEAFEKSDSNVKDGMDISLCSISGNKILWSGANNPLWYIEAGEMKEITATKQTVGKTESPHPFLTHSLELKPNDTLYLFTDGYADQFGGPKGKKLKYSLMKSILDKNKSKALLLQKENLEKEFEIWKGDLEQVDDVLIIGIKI